jgi:hypothetical protein
VAEGEFRPEIDGEQFAHDVYGVMLAFHHAARLLRDPKAKARARTAFESLLSPARRTSLEAPVEGEPTTRPGDRGPGQESLTPERTGVS